MLAISYLVLTMWWFHDDRSDQSDLLTVMTWSSIFGANGWYAWQYHQGDHVVLTISAVFIVCVASWKLWQLWTFAPSDCDED